MGLWLMTDGREPPPPAICYPPPAISFPYAKYEYDSEGNISSTPTASGRSCGSSAWY